ncbi:hypothetical protein HW49_05670 [Porphyromonadaceae bacterium COT-184 OH4590]|nr:hypothetical protein HW49_05670 [Porphyromonadaceae bacterium COT-184 OH4590]
MKKIFFLILATSLFVCCKKSQPSINATHDVEINGVKFEFVDIPAGDFFMGSPENEVDRAVSETKHKVILDGFYMSKYEVTQAQWKAVMETDTTPSFFKGDNLPVEMVNYEEVHNFIAKLNSVTGKNYRLPTEAEWEYACRAGTSTPFNTGNTITVQQANFDGTEPYNGAPVGEFREKSLPVGSFAPNAWGLYDMHGNIWEWCSDWYSNEYYNNSPEKNPQGPDRGYARIVRGGSWDEYAKQCRSAYRSAEDPKLRFISLGFRLVHPK